MNVLQYCWVGSTCPPPLLNHDHIRMSHIKQALSSTPFCAGLLKFPALHDSCLCGSHAPMSGSTFVSSPLTGEGRSCSITTVNPLLPLCSLGPVSAADKENPPPPDPRSALASLAHFTGVGSLLAAAAVHDHPTVPRTHRRALASYGDTLTTPSPAGYYVNIPSLPPSLPPSHPAAAGRPDSHRIPRILLAWRRFCTPETVDG